MPKFYCSIKGVGGYEGESISIEVDGEGYLSLRSSFDGNITGLCKEDVQELVNILSSLIIDLRVRDYNDKL